MTGSGLDVAHDAISGVVDTGYFSEANAMDARQRISSR
jgi:hypothetical protein